MRIYMLWGQRKCDYPNQYAPELLGAVDEFTDEDNPSWLDGKLKEYFSDKEFVSVSIIRADVDDDVIDQALAIPVAKLDNVAVV